jgi:2-iminobutanoate/2-iminopropanoate deaminase
MSRGCGRATPDETHRPIQEAIRTEQAPAAIGPYSQGIRCRGGHWIFTAGQIGLDPRTGALVPGGVRAECDQALRNLRAVLEAGGASLERVVKVTVFLLDMGEFAEMNAVYETFFTSPFPARSAAQVSGLPRGARVEVEAVALGE